MTDLSFSTVNASPCRYFVSQSDGSASTSTTGLTYVMILLDMSGSNTDATRKQLEDLILFLEAERVRAKTTKIPLNYKVFVWCFGVKTTDDPIYGQMGKEWAPLKKLNTYFTDRVRRSGGKDVAKWVSYFPWPTYTALIQTALRQMNTFVASQSGPDEVSRISLCFIGDGQFSDRNFIPVVRNSKVLNELDKVVSFTSIFAENTPDATKATLTRELQEILMPTARHSSVVKFATHKLDKPKNSLSIVFQKIDIGGTVAKSGYSSILNEQFHNKLTPGSVATILKSNKSLISKYISFIVDQFDKCPRVFTSDEGLLAKIYKALIILSHFKNDTFSIGMYLMDRMSVLADKKDFLAPQRKVAIAQIRKQDNSAYMLAREKLLSFYTGRFISLTNLPAFDFDAIMRDASCTKLINFMDSIWNEHSECAFAITETRLGRGDGLPILRSDTPDTEVMTGFKMCSGLFGIPETVISNNALLVIAMYIMTSDSIEEDDSEGANHLKSVCKRFIFNDTGTLRALVFKEDGTLHDNMYCAGYARVVYNFFTIFGGDVDSLTPGEIGRLRSIFTALCKIIGWRSFTYHVDIPKITFDFHIGDLVLISPKSWGEKSCPLVNMPNIAMIIPPTTTDRSYHVNKYKCQFTEGDAKDYFYVAPEFLTMFLVHDSYGAVSDPVTSVVENYTNTDAYKALRRYQRDTWMANLHENKVRLKDGSFDLGGGSTEFHMTYKEQMAALVALPAVARVFDPSVLVPKLIKCSTEVPKNMLGAILGMNVWKRTMGVPLSFKRPAIELIMGHSLATAGILSDGYAVERARLASHNGSSSDPEEWNVPIESLFIESFKPYAKYTLTGDDTRAIVDAFTREFSLIRSGSECDCGCGFSLGPSTDSVSPGCGHKYLKACWNTWFSSSSQDPRDIHLTASTCPMGCVSCLQDPIVLSSGQRVARSDLSDEVVASSTTNCIAICESCTRPNVMYPRSCTTHMDDVAMRCVECSDQVYWPCPTEGCSMLHEHNGGCRWMRCCPIHTSFDNPCTENCKFTLLGDFDNVIAKGCGQPYKMGAGLVEDGGGGARESDGSHWY